MNEQPNLEDLFPSQISSSPDALKDRFVRLSQDTYPSPSDNFSIAVPTGWEAVETAGTLGNSGFFSWMLNVRPPERDGASVEVVQAPMTHEVNASDWVKVALDALPERILGMREFASPAGMLPDLLSQSEDGALMRRTIGMRDAKKIWVASVQLPKDEFEERAEDVLFALASFKLSDPAGPMPIETLQRYRSAEFMGLRFEFPKSWSHRITRETPTRLRVSLENRLDDQIVGSVLVRGWARDQNDERTAASILNEHRRSLAEKGLAPNQAPWSIVETQNPEELWVADTKGIFRGQTLSLTTILKQSDRAWVLLGLVSADRISEPRWWAVNKRALEIVQQELTV